MALTERRFNREPSPLRADSGERPIFRVEPPPGAVIQKIRQQAKAAVGNIEHAYEAPANDQEEVIELSSDDLEVDDAAESSGVFSIQRDQHGRQVEISRYSPEDKAKIITAELNERFMALNRLDETWAQTHEYRRMMTPYQGNPNIAERIQQADREIESMDQQRAMHESVINLLEKGLRTIVDKAAKSREVPQVQPPRPEARPASRDYQAPFERSALVQEAQQLSQQITHEGIQTEALADKVLKASARAQQMQRNVESIKTLISKESGFLKRFAERLSGGNRRAQLEAELRAQEGYAAEANAEYRKGLEAVAAHNQQIDRLYSRHDSIKDMLTEMDRAAPDQRLAA